MRKFILILFLFNMLNFLLIGQNTFNRQFEFGFPSPILTSILPTDSCYYVTGISRDSISPYNAGNLFIKFDLDGNIELFKSFFSPSKTYETWTGDLIPTSDGGLIDVGYSFDSIQTAFLVKYTTDGDTVFLKQFFNILFPDYDFIVPRKIKKIKDGYAILFGHDAGVDGEISLMRLDSNFNTIFYKDYGTSFTELPENFIVDKDGGFIIGASKSNIQSVWQDYFSQTYILKTDSLGEVEWEFLNPQISSESLRNKAVGLVQTADGGLVVASGIGIEVWVNASSGQLRWDGMIFKLDSMQNIEWETPFRGIKAGPSQGFTDLIEVSDGSGYVAVGRTAEDENDFEPSVSAQLVKVSLEGDSLWSRYYNFFNGIDEHPKPYDFKETPDGGFVIVGSTVEIDIPGGKSYAWLMKVDEHGCLVPGCHIIDDVSEEEKEPIQIKLYPNPTTDFLNVFIREQSNNASFEFRISDSMGKVIQTFQNRFSEETILLPLKNYGEGSYFFQVFKDNVLIKTEKFMVGK